MLKTCFLASLCVFGLLACSNHSNDPKTLRNTAKETMSTTPTTPTNAQPEGNSGIAPPGSLIEQPINYPQLSKALLAKTIARIARKTSFTLSTRKTAEDKKLLFQTFCTQLHTDFIKGDITILRPDSIASSKDSFNENTPRKFKAFDINDFYVEHQGKQVKYSSPQPPFEFYHIPLGDKTFSLMHYWFSQLADKQGSFNNKGQYRIYNHQEQQFTQQTLEYSSNGPHPDHSSSEGFHVLFIRKSTLYLVNTRQYFNRQTPPDFLTFKQFDASTGQFLDACQFYGGHLLGK